MAIVTVGEHTKSDSRFRRWGKVITSVDQIDLEQKGGYAIKGTFVRWGEAVALAPNQFIVACCETGSRKNHSYDYYIYRVAADGFSSEFVQDEEIVETINKSGVPERVKAACKNSTLYEIATFIQLQLLAAQRVEA